MGKTFDVFMSHNSADKTEVAAIARDLRDAGLSVWLDEWELMPGTKWQEELEKAIAGSSAVAVFIGKSGLGPWEINEFRASLDRSEQIAVIPVILASTGEPGRKPELPPFLSARTWVDMREGSYREHLKRLQWGITRERSEPQEGFESEHQNSSKQSSAAHSKAVPEPQRHQSRDEIRAFLQRCEVRLSTMHRIAGAFISGAGLLLLLPLFLKDSLVSLVKICAAMDLSWKAIALQLAPAAVAFVIPIIAMYLLIRELVMFYFSANIPNVFQHGLSRTRIFHPRFALTGIPFPDDEVDLKKEIRLLQFGTDLINFVLPRSDNEQQWLIDLEADPKSSKIALPESSIFLEKVYQGEEKDALDQEVRCLRMAFGLAGSYDRNLKKEAAKSELSLIRHNLLLRRLVLRYAKAFMLFLWTACVIFPFIAVANSLEPTTAALGLPIAFLVWSAFAPYFVRAPVRWIYSEFTKDSRASIRDPHLVKFEHFICWLCTTGTVLGTLGSYQLSGAHLLIGVFAVLANIVLLARAYNLIPWSAI